LVAAGVAENFRDGAALAEQAIRNGHGAKKLEDLQKFGRE
jgi:anthranilate phosphoribosyltransferase